MTPELVLCGCLTLDNVLTAEGVRLPQAYAGNALYAALGARLWSDSVGIVARAGADYPQACFDLLSVLGVDFAGIRRSSKPHGRNMAFFYKVDGSRVRRAPPEVIAAMPPEERGRFVDTTLQPDAREKWLEFSPDAEDAPDGWWERARGVHCAAIPMARQSAIVSTARRRGGPRVWSQIDSPWQDRAAQGDLDGGGAFLSWVDAVLPSEADLEDFMPGAPQPVAAEALLRASAGTVVLKRGGEGCDIYRPDGVVHIPAVATKIVDLTGAGDAFCGGFLAGVCATGDVIAAARQGAVSASFAIEQRGVEGLARADRREAAERLASLA